MPNSQNAKARLVIFIPALVIFAVATIWINYEVKVNVQGGGHGGGSVRTMGNVKIGDPAPGFSALDLSNQTVSLSDYRNKKVVLLDFWATWCGPCRMEMVDLQALQDKFKDRNFEILSVNQGEDASQIRPFMSRKKYGFHVLLDSNQQVADKYGVKGIPTLVLVDKEGVIQWLQVGYGEDDSELEHKIESLTTKFNLTPK